jgi:hypothetical protein
VCTRLAATSDKVYQLLAHGRWFSPGTSASSTTKTGRLDIAEILLKVALSTINQIKSNQFRMHLKRSIFSELFRQCVCFHLIINKDFGFVDWDQGCSDKLDF